MIREYFERQSSLVNIETYHGTSLRSLFDLVKLLVQRDLRVRYRGSVLGYMWSMMNPLLYMLILTFVFRHVAKFQMENYSTFILSGILTWNLFQQSLAIGVNSIVANAALLRKVKVPSSLFPAASVCSVLFNFSLALIPFLIIALISGLHITGWILLLPVVVIPYAVFIFGIALAVSSLNVFYRDVGHTLEPLLTILFYGTPIFYRTSDLPEKYQFLSRLNPLTHFLDVNRKIMFEGVPPELSSVLIIFALAALSIAIGILVYRKTRDQFVFRL